jgi:hypothetical protein
MSPLVVVTTQVPLSSPDGWVKLNLGQHAPLRVSYPPELLRRLAAGVADKSLPATDRLVSFPADDT